jgi:hypothetical protein
MKNKKQLHDVTRLQNTAHWHDTAHKQDITHLHDKQRLRNIKLFNPIPQPWVFA